MDDFGSFCGIPANTSFTVWDTEKKIFTNCFSWLILSTPVHCLFLITCTYLIGRSKFSRAASFSIIRKRVATCLLTVIVSCSVIAELALNYFIEDDPPIAYTINSVIVLLAWIGYGLLQFRIRQTYAQLKLYNRLFFAISLLLLITQALQAYSTITKIANVHESVSAWSVKDFSVLIYTVLVLCFFLKTLVNLVKMNRGDFVGRSSVLHAQVDGDDESDINENDVTFINGKYGRLTDDKIEHLGTAESTSNIFSKLTFWWVNDLVKRCYNKQLGNAKDLFHLGNDLSTSYLRKQMSDSLKEAKAASGNGHKHKSLIKILVEAHGRVYFIYLGFAQLMIVSLDFTGPVFLNLLVKFMENHNEPISHGYYYAGALFVLNILNVLVLSHYTYTLEKTRTKIRAGLITAIFEKAMLMNSATLTSSFTTGEVVNFMSSDVTRITNFCYSFHDLWSMFLQFGVCFYLLYSQLGISSIAGVGVMLLTSPFMFVFTKKLKTFAERLMTDKDERVKLITEVLNGIRIIKFYAWEKHFENEISHARAAEMKSLKGYNYTRAFAMSVFNTTPLLIAVSTFALYIGLGNQLTAAKVFTSISLFSILNRPFNLASWSLSRMTEAWVSVKRIEKFLFMPEVSVDDYYTYFDFKPEDRNENILEVDNATFTWKKAKEDETENDEAKEKESKELVHVTSASKKEGSETQNIEATPFSLSNICFAVKKGSFVGITGRVGCGKSSVFAALTTEMDKESGAVCVPSNFGGFGFVSQESWIQNMTVRDNILFGKEFDEEKYDTILHACALKEDIEVLPAGDKTEIGENGINLSGGQKARISLARAMYQDKEIYLLDDPLAAVDAHVAAHIFQYCIMGLLKDKTRILSTHHFKYLQAADLLILMKDGAISSLGDPAEVLKDEKMFEMVQQYGKPQVNEKEDEEEENKDTKDDKDSKTNGTLVEEEEKAKDAVDFEVYKQYVKATGIFVFSVTVFGVFITIASSLTANWWLAYWTGNVAPKPSDQHKNVTTAISYVNLWSYSSSSPFHDTGEYSHAIPTTLWYASKDDSKAIQENNWNFYLPMYIAITGVGVFGQILRAFVQAYGSIKASTALHKRLVLAILNAPIVFFDITPIGRITNRFSSDIYQLDTTVAIYAQAALMFFFNIIGIFIMTCYSLPWFTIPMIPIAGLYYFIQQYYRHSSRELKRLASVTLSPIYQHFSESLSGLMTIRAFREGERFMLENETRLDLNQRSNFAITIVSIWLLLRLGALGVAMVGSVGLLAVLEHHFKSANAGLVGLAISFSLSMENQFKRFVQCFTETEKSMVNTERISHYIHQTPQERICQLQMGTFWPFEGKIAFKDVSLRYREELPLVVNEISFEVKGGEKIGICGRTGSGKSSLFRMLFKIVDLTNGAILIDGIDISDANTEHVRSRLSIIPQDPFLFDDSVSRNLDPRDEFSDDEKYDVLRKCHLLEAVQNIGGLPAKAGERGSNFSTGQKQLLCLARALLKKSKIICIDEATASVDHKTDKLIQETIRREFEQSTVLTIAHRIETILDSDRVLVMHYGKIAEFDSPNNLLQDTNSLFTSLVSKHGANKD